MSANHQKVTIHFDRMTEAYGINGAGRLHRALLKGPITPQVREKVRAYVATAQPKSKMH